MQSDNVYIYILIKLVECIVKKKQKNICIMERKKKKKWREKIRK